MMTRRTMMPSTAGRMVAAMAATKKKMMNRVKRRQRSY